MYAAYLYILRAFDSAAASHLKRSPDPEREIADGRGRVLDSTGATRRHRLTRTHGQPAVGR